jgi:hypothetical protein
MRPQKSPSMRIQAGDIFVNSLEGLLFSTPLLLSSINARAAAKGSSLLACPGSARFGARVGGPESENVEQISEDRNDGRSD